MITSRIAMAIVTALLGMSLCVLAAGKEKWAYVQVRPQAHMFWWLYFSTSPAGFEKVPLVIWLQGGPGASSTGFGNFEEIGPLNGSLHPRSTTWLSKANLLFIDNPVGTGFSYAESDSAYATTNDQIAADLVNVVKNFYKDVPEIHRNPLFVFSESYGGKMTIGFARALNKAIKQGEIKCDFRGVALGDSWISPIDSVLTWGPYLYSTSLVDETGLNKINKLAVAAQAAIKAGQWGQATDIWSSAEEIIEEVAANVNFYNIMKWQGSGQIKEFKARFGTENSQNDDLASLMNGPIRKKLGNIPKNVVWGSQSDKVFAHLKEDFMKSVVDVVDEMLEIGFPVAVYSGQLDLIVDTLGTEKWVQELKWSGLPSYNNATRVTMTNEKTGFPVGFYKQHKNFSFYWILNSGHMVPQDVGETALQLLELILKKNK